MKYYLYILHSKKYDKYYTGVSQDPAVRLRYHNTKEKGFTSRYRPWELVFTKEFDNKQSAFRAERQIKKWKSKKMIELLIAGKISISV